MLQAIEGSAAVARAVGLCRPEVVATYPITPQTHIVENLAQLIADGNLRCELVSVKSEFSCSLRSSRRRRLGFRASIPLPAPKDSC
jgi:pyruvate ferredoxin oxidoreductase alpha subunit